MAQTGLARDGARARAWLASALDGERLGLGLFAGTLLLSAFLLFSVQPLFAKLVLPRLGGAPAVWAISMCFFQAALLGGYCYAHVLNRWLSLRHAMAVHLGALALAFAALPIGLPQAMSEPPTGAPYLWLMGILAAGAGVPFVVISATAPLLQTWFARSGHRQSADPYFLYAASNIGSLVALLAYPVAIEPFLGLASQTSAWSGGFLALAAAILASGAYALVHASAASTVTALPSAARGITTWRRRGLWVALAFVPSGLLVAFTTFMTTDIASAPFLWVMPLALFLVTFILAFRERPVFPHAALLVWQPRLVAFTAIGLGLLGDSGWILSSVCGVVAFFVTAMVCHRELYIHRPAPEHLTGFYLWMSLGGVLGGMFAALAAPQIFNTILEFPLLMVLGLALRPDVRRAMGQPAFWRASGLLLAGGLLVVLALEAGIRHGLLPPAMVTIMVGTVTAFACGLLIAAGRPAREMAMAGLMVAALVILPFGKAVGQAERSFFGVHRVIETADGQHRLLMHGVTMHGAERLADAAGKPTTALVPLTYYHPASPMARGVEVARAARARLGGRLAVGVVGLGTGAMACNVRPGERLDYFEIDPVVVEIARDARRFRYLSHCHPDARIVLGDARLTLAKEAAGTYDYLLIDAFSSDAIPVHMLTREALDMYLDRLTPGGLLALHISNRHLDLRTVVARLLPSLAVAGAVHVFDRTPGPTHDVSISRVVLLAKDQAGLAAALALPYAERLRPEQGGPWTDDYSDILSALWREAWN